MDLSGVGVWSSQLRYGHPAESAEAAAELEELGFSALWIPDVGGPVLDSVALLLPEQAVLLTDSRDAARAVGTDWLRRYLALPNYANNLLRSGFTQDDLDSVSDGLFDAIIAWGDEDAVVQRVNEHRAAGADHVCVQALATDPLEFPREQWRRLAAALT